MSERAGQGGAGRGRAGQGRAEQGRAGRGGAGQGRAGQGRVGQGRAGQGRAGQGRAGQGRGRGMAKFCREYHGCVCWVGRFPMETWLGANQGVVKAIECHRCRVESRQ